MARKEDAEAVATGVKRGGKVEWDDIAAFAADLKALPDGPVIVSVERASARAIRTIKANRYYFGVVLKLIAEDTGQDKEEIHDFMCDKFLKRTVLIVNRDTGETEEYQVARRSSKLQPDEFYTFVEEARLFAAEFFGISTPDPDPDYWRHGVVSYA